MQKYALAIALIAGISSPVFAQADAAANETETAEA